MNPPHHPDNRPEWFKDHDADEMRRYDIIAAEQAQLRGLISDHVELDKQQHEHLARNVANIDRKLGAMEGVHVQLNQTLAELGRIIDKSMDRLADVEGAYPKDEDGKPDYHGHRDYHRKLISDAADMQIARTKVMHRVMEGGAWGTVVFIGYTVWDYIKAHVK